MAGLFDCACIKEYDKNLLISALANEKSIWEKAQSVATNIDQQEWLKVISGIISHADFLIELIEETPNCGEKTKEFSESEKLGMAEAEISRQAAKDSGLNKLNIITKESIIGELRLSQAEEKQAYANYINRAVRANSKGDLKTFERYTHIADEELHHAEEFSKRIKELGG